jgi:hypothetical protein
MASFMGLSHDEQLKVKAALDIDDFEGAVETVFGFRPQATRDEAVDAVEAVRTDDPVSRERAKFRTALQGLYNVACHHPKCERDGRSDRLACTCGVSAALAVARRELGK